jgi:hypothetical protein
MPSDTYTRAQLEAAGVPALIITEYEGYFVASDEFDRASIALITQHMVMHEAHDVIAHAADGPGVSDLAQRALADLDKIGDK